MREKLSYTQTAFATLIGLSSGAMSNVENDKRQPTFESLLSICEVASSNGFNLVWLFTGKESPEEKIRNETIELDKLEYELLGHFNKLDRDDKLRAIGQLSNFVTMIPKKETSSTYQSTG